MTGALLGPDPSATTADTAVDWLEGATLTLELPADHVRPSVLSGSTARLRLPLPAPARDAVQSLATRTDTDVETVVLAVFSVLLARTTDEADLLLGLAGRTGPPRDAVEVLRTPVDLSVGLRSVIGSTARAVAEARDRGPRTVADWATDAGLEPGPGRHPVFQVAVLAESGTDESTSPGAWSVPPDLVLRWRADPGEVVLQLEWATELFEPSRIGRLGGHLVQLLLAGAEDDGAAVGLLPLLTQEELDELDSWNRTDAPHDPTRTLADRFWTSADATPDAVAVEADGGAVSYRELARRAAAVAAVLRSHGVDADSAVVVCAERSVDMLVGVLGTLMAGGGYVPVDPAYPAGRRDFMISDCAARVVLTQRALLPLVPADAGADVVLLDDLPATDELPREQLRGRSGHDLGYVVYTSGSTGQPKGVAMPQSALGNLVDWQLRRPGFAPCSRTLQFSALSFDVSFQEMFTTWASGGTLVLVDEATRRDPARLLGHLVEHRVQRLFLPYVALRGLASAATSSGQLPTDLREVYTAGEQLRVDPVLRALFDGVPDAVLENQYGPSESHVVTAHTLDRDRTQWPALPPIGGPIANSQVHVLDARLQRRPVGVPGELHLGGACLARGYLGQDDLTQERFIAAPDELPGPVLYRTGDLARWLPTGELEFLGRLDHQVKFRGYRIEPGEVAAVLSAGPGIEQCVAQVRDVGAGPRLTAYLVPTTGLDPDLGAVHRYAKEHLPAHMVPSHYLVVPALPLTSSGKIDTAALPDAAFDRGILTRPYQAAVTREEQVLVSLWSLLLGIPEVGVLDDFYELGGDSLLAAEMAQRVADELGREMPLGALAQAPTIQGLAALLRTDDARMYRSLVPLQAGVTGTTPLFVVHGGSGNVATFPRLARALPAEQPVYGLQWDGFGGGRGQTSVEKMARHYLSEIREVQPHGPYLLAGQCIGGLVAHEMTRRLLETGEEVRVLVLYDAPNLVSPDYVGAPHRSLRRVLAEPRHARAAAYEAARAVYHRTPTKDRVKRGSRVMRSAALRYRPTPLPAPVPTHFVGSGESRGSAMRLEGHWTDGAMGWAHRVSDDFEVHRLVGDHNSILYDEEALDILRTALHRAHGRVDTARRG